MKGEPKWDWIISLQIPLHFRRVKIKVDKIGRGFLKRLANRLKIKL